MHLTAPPSYLLTRRQAASYLAISQRKLDALAASGEIDRVKIGSSVRFDPGDLDRFITENKS